MIRGRARLTKRVVEALQPRRAQNYVIWDSEVPGFGVRVHRGAQRVWRAYVFRYSPRRIRGTKAPETSDRWITIGEHGMPWRPDPVTGRARTLTAELARDEALRLRGLRNAGGDPKAEYRQAEPEPAPARGVTLRTFAPVYLEAHADVRKGLRSAREDRGNLERHLLPSLGDTPLDSIDYTRVDDLHGSLKDTPATANRCLSLLSTVIEVARRRGILPRSHHNPCRDVRRFAEPKRERFLTVDELGRVGAALAAEEAGAPVAAAAIRLLAITGARPTELLTLKREQLHLDQGHVMVLRKGRWLPIYLPEPAVRIIEGLAAKPGNPYLFPGRIVANHLTLAGVEVLWGRVRAAAALDDVRLYDLRHTVASHLAQGGTSLPIIGAVLGHLRTETTKRYAHLAPSPVRAAGEEVARKIAEALGSQATAAFSDEAEVPRARGQGRTISSKAREKT